jgi:hypothetical protein
MYNKNTNMLNIIEKIKSFQDFPEYLFVLIVIIAFLFVLRKFFRKNTSNYFIDLAFAQKSRSRELIPEEEDPNVLRLRDGLEKGNFRAAQKFLAATTEPNARAFFISALSEWKGRPDWLDAWGEAFPKSEIPLLIRGSHSIKWAWEARGNAVADQVDLAMWPIFLSRLQMAEEDLKAAAKMNPADATPWAWLLTTALGLQLKESEAQKRFEEAIRRAPDHWAAHRGMFAYLCKKWHGSHEKMFEFARSRSKSASKGSPLHALIPLAHLEIWIYMGVNNQSEQAKMYMASQDVKNEIERAYSLFLDLTQAPASAVFYFYGSLNTFAFCFAMSKDHKNALHAFRMLEDHYRPIPWSYLGGREAFERLKSYYKTLEGAAIKLRQERERGLAPQGSSKR